MNISKGTKKVNKWIDNFKCAILPHQKIISTLKFYFEYYYYIKLANLVM